MSPQIDFGYPWFITYGHLVVAGPVLAMWVIGRRRKWPKVLEIFIGALLLWSLSAFAVARFVLDINGRASLPSPGFLSAGQGRVLDMGAGTGRSALMVLEARPNTTLVALDLFGESYRQHFGSAQSGREKLLSNLRAAGLEQRVSIQAGDMRKMPFDAASFDGVVTAYAIDHLGRDGAIAALGEAYRVLKPGGEFLMMVIAKDRWVNFAFGPLLLHSGTRGPEWWTARLQDAGFQVVEQGSRPATLYIRAVKPGA